MAKKIDKPPQRIVEELSRALSKLRKANELWEQDHFDQSEQIATLLRLMLYDKPGSPSIFKQLDMKRVDFYANPLFVKIAGTPDIIRLMAYPHTEGLYIVGEAPRNDVCWRPVYCLSSQAVDCPFPIDYKAPWAGSLFEQWWNEPILHGDKFSYSRGGLIRTLANRLGGAHSDVQIEQHELDLLEERFGYGYTSFALVANGVRTTPKNKVYEAVIRQISYEVERTVSYHFKQYLPPADVVPPLPDAWGDLSEITVRDNRSPEEKNKLYEQHVAATGELSGIAELIRGEMYWERYRAEKRKHGL